jgi:hypothetical protein
MAPFLGKASFISREYEMRGKTNSRRNTVESFMISLWGERARDITSAKVAEAGWVEHLSCEGIPVYKTGPGTDQSASRRLEYALNKIGGKLWKTRNLWRIGLKVWILMAKKKQKMAKKKFTVPKVKVEKQAFDKVLGKLIQSEPQPEKRLK